MQKKIVSVFLFVMVVHTITCMESVSNISVDLVLSHPDIVLKQNMRDSSHVKCAFKQYMEENGLLKPSWDMEEEIECMAYYCQYRPEFPLFLLFERPINYLIRRCGPGMDEYDFVMQHSQDDMQSRLLNPSIRNRFDEKVSELLSRALEKNPYYFATYASFNGQRFSDVCIITRVLAQHPTACIVMHCIASTYANIIPIQENLKRVLKGKYGADDIELIKASALRFRQLGQWRFLENSFEYVAQLRQFKKWVKTNFPHAQLMLLPHNTVEQCLDYCSSRTYPDVICGTDIDSKQEETGYPYRCDYALLCIKSLQHNSTSQNVYLGKENSLFRLLLDRERESDTEVKTHHLPPFYVSEQVMV